MTYQKLPQVINKFYHCDMCNTIINKYITDVEKMRCERICDKISKTLMYNFIDNVNVNTLGTLPER